MAAPTLARTSGDARLTVQQLLALHPFPDTWAGEKRIERLWVFDVEGTPEMRFEERDGKRWGTAKNGGVRHDWIEVPWNWVANQWLTCLRIYEGGPTGRVRRYPGRLDPHRR